MAATNRAKKSSTMPIEGYDRLSIREVVPHLTALSGPQLKAVTAYEKAGKNRVTLLRAVRRVELEREAVAAAGKKGGRSKRLAVVEPENLDADHDLAPVVSVDANNSLDPVPYLEVVEDRDSMDAYGAADDLAPGDSFEMADDFDSDFDDDFDRAFESGAIEPGAIEPGAAAESDAPGDDNSRSFDLADFDDDVVDDLDDDADDDIEDDDIDVDVVPEPVVAVVVAPSKKAPKAPKAPKASKPVVEKKPRSRPAVKAATWEEEVRPQLPRRMEAAAVALEMDLEPPIVQGIDMEPFEDDMRSAPTGLVGSKPLKPGKAPNASAGLASGPLRAIKKFENVALVMAAILAILLGLAIGTVLARTGSSEAGQTPASAVSASAAVHAGN